MENVWIWQLLPQLGFSMVRYSLPWRWGVPKKNRLRGSVSILHFELLMNKGQSLVFVT